MPTNKDIEAGYIQMAMEKVAEGWTPTMLTFVYNQLTGSPTTVHTKMAAEIERVYASILPRVVRYPRSRSSIGKLPIWLAIPDFPVEKFGIKRDHLANIAPNGGEHRHALALTPPVSRMRCSLSDFIDNHPRQFASPALVRVHAQQIKYAHDRAFAYIVKGLKRGTATADDMLILPRAQSELPERPVKKRRTRH